MKKVLMSVAVVAAIMAFAACKNNKKSEDKKCDQTEKCCEANKECCGGEEGCCDEAKCAECPDCPEVCAETLEVCAE